MQGSCDHASAYGGTVNAEGIELRASKHTVLPANQARDRTPAPSWQRIGADSATDLCHLAMVAPGA